MQKLTLDHLRLKNKGKKEINICFSESQDKADPFMYANNNTQGNQRQRINFNYNININSLPDDGNRANTRGEIEIENDLDEDNMSNLNIDENINELNNCLTSNTTKSNEKHYKLLDNFKAKLNKNRESELDFWEANIAVLKNQLNLLTKYIEIRSNKEGSKDSELKTQLNNYITEEEREAVTLKKCEYKLKLDNLLEKIELISRERESEGKGNKSNGENGARISGSNSKNYSNVNTYNSINYNYNINTINNNFNFNDNRNKKQSSNKGIGFNKLDQNDIKKQVEYHGFMTTTGGEMCRSRLGNKLLLSLNVNEINKNQCFNSINLAYPVLKKKKIEFTFGGKEGKNNKKLMNMNDFNSFALGNFNDGINTVY